MKIQKLNKELQKEFAKQGLTLVWGPESNLRVDELVVIGAEQSNNAKDKPLIAGFGPGGFSEDYGNSPATVIGDYRNKFLEALENVGIPQDSLHSNYPYVGRDKIWPTFVARLTQKEFSKLKL